ncbi:transmembrane channel-like protein 3 [Coccinella septempunctata]|uniref:transmembrane channel-like protein 3 n=1 Tax=Coccinella septempunctata TaxID=41139 RepID=UPI001D08D2B5|nr:transmembrane channel-like protein 3 [Coccinella septempunctata]
MTELTKPSTSRTNTERVSVTFADDVEGVVSRRSSSRLSIMENMQLPNETAVVQDSDEEDYSASVNAIIQRRASTRRSKRRRDSRRASSPYTPDVLPSTENDRRRSSAFTTSSGDTAITVEDSVQAASQEQIFENIKIHKEVLQYVKMQPWDMRKKLKLVIQAKAYIKRHEGALQERLANSGSTKDRLARFYIYFLKNWQKFRRELSNTSNWFIPWEQKIKEIESHFGSVVASYFLFLRWLFWVNIVIAGILLCFVTVPELFTADPKEAGDRKVILPEEKYSSTNFLTLWDFKGYFEISPLFYGWYTNNDDSKRRYRLPLAYFITGLVVYAYSFFATLRKMAKNSRMSKLSEKDDECIFSWKLFTAWDYMIGNSEAAHNRVASIVMGFKEALLEEAEKKREVRNWKITSARVFVNFVILGLFTCSAGSVVYLVKRSTEEDGQRTFWRSNELTIVMSLISLIFPMLFDAMGYLERYHPRKQLRIQLARIMVLNLLNLYSLIISQFDKIHGMSGEMTGYFNNLTSHKNLEVIDGDFERPPNIPIDRDVVYCFRKCYINSTKASKPLLIASLILNSSILNQDNMSTPNYSKESSTPSITPSILLEDNSGDDYPNYNEYFAQDGETGSSVDDRLNPLIPTLLTTDSLETSEDYTTWSTEIDESASSTIYNKHYFHDELNEEDEKNKYTDYLTYILSVVDRNATHLKYENKPWTISEESIYSSLTTLDVESSSLNEEIVTSEHFGDSTVSSTVTHTIANERHFHTQKTAATEEDLVSASTANSNLSSTTVAPKEQPCETPSEPIESAPLCEWVCEEEKPINMTEVGYLIRKMNNTDRKKLRGLCWETMFGQDLIKLTVMDLIMTFLSTMAVDFFRAVFVRVMNNCWCWDLEKVFPKYSDFKVAENILHLVNNQGMIWMGLFFSPGLAVVNVVKLYMLMYLRAWTVLTCNVPPEVIFRASKSNNFYYALLLMMLFLCVLPVGYAMVVIKPSWYCGPFSGYKRMYTILTETITKITPRSFDHALQYIVSPGSIIPLLVLLILIIYYLTSLTSSLREANIELKLQLRRERTEERRKVFQLVDRRRRVGSAGSDPNNPLHKWKKLLNTFPSNKSVDDPGKLESFDQSMQSDSAKDGKDFFSRLIKRALGKSSNSNNNNYNRDDASDLDQQDSLPHDLNKNNENNGTTTPKRRTSSSASTNLRQLVKILPTNKENNGTTTEIQRNNTEEYIVQDNSNIPKEEDSKRQGSVSSNWSDNIPVITISDIEQVELREKQKIPNILDPSEPNASTGVSFKEKIKPKVKYALKKQSTEIDEESIRHFHREIMKQRSQTLVHDTFREELELKSLEKPIKMEESHRSDNNRDQPSNEESRVTFKTTESEQSSLDRKDSVFY